MADKEWVYVMDDAHLPEGGMAASTLLAYETYNSV